MLLSSPLLQSPTLSITTDFFFLAPSLPPCLENSGTTGKLKSLSDRKEGSSIHNILQFPSKSLHYLSSNTNLFNREGNEIEIWMLLHGRSEKMEEKHPQQLFRSPQSSYKPWPRCSMPKFSKWEAVSCHQLFYRLMNNVLSAPAVIAATSNKEIYIASKPSLGLKADHESDVPNCC